jgi:hypothetical protein
VLLAGAAVAVVALGYTWGVEPLLARHRQVEELVDSRHDLLARQHRLLAREPALQAELEALRVEIAGRRGRLLPGDKPPLAASELQALVKATAAETGVEVRSERVLPTAERGGFVEVPIEVTLAGPIRALVAMLHRLEGAPVLLTLGEFRLRVISVAQPRELSATVALTGYIASSGPEAGRAGAAEPGRRTGS